jgi:cysteine desulfurase family protein
MIYFDNAATSWPKPTPVIQAVTHFLQEVGANPGRSGHRLAVEASRIVYQTREAICTLVNAPDPLRVAFGHNVTEALNVALMGLLQPGDHIITSSMEHNSVMRPLRALQRDGVELTVVQCSPEGYLEVGDVERSIKENTRLLAINHASNVTGTLLPVGELGRVARKHDLLLLVDSAQTAGACPLDVQKDAIDLLAFTGHKSLMGMMGTGGLIVGERVDPGQFRLLKRGGTGSRSESEEQPQFFPDLLESGTANASGLAGLGAGIRWVLEHGVESIRAKEMTLAQRLIDGLCEVPGVTVYGGLDAQLQTATVAFNIVGFEPSDVALNLDDNHGIMCRASLHCAPAAHKTVGTFPSGSVRFSLGAFNTMEQVDTSLEAVRKIASGL